MDRGLVEESGTAESTGGRPSGILAFRARAGCLLAVDLGLSSIDVAVTDLAGDLIAQRALSYRYIPDPESTVAQLDQMIRDLLTNTPDLPPRLWGIGVGVPTRIEFRSGHPTDTAIAGWNSYPLPEILTARYGVLTCVDNDVNVMALGELRAGVAHGHEHVIFVKVGTGIGASIIVGGRLYRGALGLAGDVGHIQVSDDPTLVCHCGKFGCLEAVAGGGALARDGELAAREGRSPILQAILLAKGRLEASDVALAAHHVDAVSATLITRAGDTIGRTLAELVNVLNPAQIVIGGGVSGENDLLLASIRRQVYAHARPLATRDLLIQRSTLPGKGGMLGAARLVADALFSAENMMRWLPDGHPAAASTDTTIHTMRA